MSDRAFRIGHSPSETRGRTLMRCEDPDGSWAEIRSNHVDIERAQVMAHRMALALRYMDIPTEETPADDPDRA